jgi:7,8-dihydropterin-6-yl-methyl-4-(beta-D-ribofuranosyl)aminobenzene 5'-phosphate synthase
MEKTKITIVCENRAGAIAGLVGEHGFCALVEKNNEKLLLDTGQGLGLISNAAALNISLDDIKKIVISHGHFDHTGGLAKLPRQRETMDIYAHPHIFNPKYVRRDGDNTSDDIGETEFIGLGLNQKKIENDLNARFKFNTRFVEISKGIFFSGEIPRNTDFELSDTRLLTRQGDDFLQDPLLDDSALLIETGSGPVILSGCSHSGIVNIMDHFSRKTGHTKFHAVIGGTHLGFLNSEVQLEKTMDAFQAYDLKLIAVSHCTGNQAAAQCYFRFRDKFSFADAGWSREF